MTQTTFISYAQNFEDVLLWRALGHVKDGFYIDVGANDPELHSVTKAFYDAGWRGINVEPMPSYRQPFEEQRPRDVNLACAAGAADGELTLFEVPSMNGWATTDAGVADMHRADGYEVTETRVPVRTLADICAQHAPAGIHFLKIDVEGFEGEVLKGMDFVRFRPWIVVVEATLPGSRETNHGTWEGMLTGQRYRFAYFDGLNRYYVADEHGELCDALAVQANVFDNFVSHHLDKALQEGKALAAQVQEHWRTVEEVAARLKARDAQLEDVNRQLEQGDAYNREMAGRLRENEALLAQADRYASETARRLEESNALLARNDRYTRELSQRIEESGAQLEQADRYAKELAQRLADNDAALERSDRHAAELAGRIAAAAQHIERLDGDLQAARQAAADAAAQADTHRAAQQAAEEREHALQDKLAATDAWARGLEARVLAIEASTSWRITAPLRLIARRGENSLPNMARRKAKVEARRALRWLTAQETLRRTLLPLIDRSPWLRENVARFLIAAKSATAPQAPPASDVPQQLRELPESARAVLADLRQAYRNQNQQ